MPHHDRSPVPHRGLLVLGCVLALVVGTESSRAGECPKDQVLAKARDIRDAPDVGITRETLSVVRLHGWRKVENLELRTRRLTVAPNGIVPTHEHDDRPSIVYVVKGEIIEHSAHCAVPILHREGEWSPEFGAGHKHWWENASGKEVVLTSSDVVPSEMVNDPHM